MSEAYGRMSSLFIHYGKNAGARQISTALPHKCGVPAGRGTLHLCGSDKFCLTHKECPPTARWQDDFRYLPQDRAGSWDPAYSSVIQHQ